MRILASLVKRSLIPGSISFLAWCLALGVTLLNIGPTMQWGRAVLTVLCALYAFLSLPAVARALIGHLQQQHGSIKAASEACGAEVLVVIGNGSVRYANGEFAAHQ